MNRFLPLLISTSLFFFSGTSAAAQLDVPETLSVLKVDNKPRSLSFFSRSTSIELGAGEHILLLQYKELFENDDEDDHVTIKSEPFVLLFKAKGDENYNLGHSVLMDESQARLFAEAPKVELYNQNEERVEIFTQNLVDFEARAIFNSMDKNHPSSLVQNVEGEVTQTQSRVATKSTQAYDMLKYWWQQASKSQKEQFMHDIKVNQ